MRYFIRAVKADAVHVLYKRIRIFAYDLHGIFSVFRVNFKRGVQRYSVFLQKHNGVLHYFDFSVRLAYLECFFLAYARHFAKPVGRVFDYVEGFESECVYQSHGKHGTYSPYYSAAEIANHSVCRIGANFADGGGFELLSELGVHDEFAFRNHRLTFDGSGKKPGAYDGLAVNVQNGYGITVFFVAESYVGDLTPQLHYFMPRTDLISPTLSVCSHGRSGLPKCP